MTNNSLIPYQEVEQFGKAMVASGFFSDVKQISQAVVKIQAGAELGLPPFASMTGIHIIKGKPVLGANVLATLVKNDPRYDYRVKKMDDTEVVIHFYEGGEMVGESSFTIQDANKAGTQNTNKFPRNMLFARAISNGAKWYTPGIFGGMSVYTPEDFGLAVDEDGGMIEGQVVETSTELKPVVPLPDDELVIMETSARAAVDVETALHQAAGKNTNPANEKQLKFARASLSKLVNGSAPDAKTILKHVFAVDSSSDLTSGEASAIIEWAGSKKENGYTPNPASIIEAARIVAAANIDAGQQPLFDEPTGNNYDD